MKACSLCRIELSLSSFNKRLSKPGRHQSICIECNKEYQKQHYKDNKQLYVAKAKKHKEGIRNKVRNLKELSPCFDCGKHYHYCQMDYDHTKKKTKEISRMYSYAWKTVLAEISKCELVCSSCHRLRTFHRRNDIIALSGI